MTDHLDEHEQGERVRKWLQSNGSSLLGGVLLGLAAIGGWQFWQGSKASHLLEAAEQYGRFQKALDQEKPDEVEAIGKALAADYSQTPYATLATLRKANASYKDKKVDEAKQQLEKAIAVTSDPVLKQLISLRIARIELGEDKADAAAARLKGVDAKSLAALRDELLGDIAMKQGKIDAARDAYKEALTGTDSASPLKNVLELKLTNAGGNPSELTEKSSDANPSQSVGS